MLQKKNKHHAVIKYHHINPLNDIYAQIIKSIPQIKYFEEVGPN